MRWMPGVRVLQLCRQGGCEKRAIAVCQRCFREGRRPLRSPHDTVRKLWVTEAMWEALSPAAIGWLWIRDSYRRWGQRLPHQIICTRSQPLIGLSFKRDIGSGWLICSCPRCLFDKSSRRSLLSIASPATFENDSLPNRSNCCDPEFSS